MNNGPITLKFYTEVQSQYNNAYILSTARHIQSGTAIAFKNVPQKQGSEKPVSYSIERPPFLT